MATSVMSDKQSVGVDALKIYPKNPRVGNIQAIQESLEQNGQFQPIVVQKDSGYILAGNHTYKAAVGLGWKQIEVVYVDVDDETAKRIVLAANRTNDLSTYNTDVLADILGSLPSPVGTGYDQAAMDSLLDSVKQDNAEQIRDAIRPPMTIAPVGDTGELTTERDNSVYAPPVPGGESGPVYTKPKPTADPEDVDDLQAELGELQGILQLREDMHFPGSNYYDIPDLASDGLLDVLPDPIGTWGGHDATPDDGTTTWVWNYGVASKKNLPMDRAILCFYTYDHHFESFWDQPAFMTAKILNAGIKTAVVPDYSYYTDTGVATWVYNNFRAQWVGRYFQEAGIKVIPRIQYAIDKVDSASLDFNCMGIPVGSPVVAKSSHNANSREEFDLEVYGLRKSLEKVQPGTLLIYGGNPAKRVIETLDPVGAGLCSEVVHIYNYAHVRRGVVFDKKEGVQSPAYRAMKKKEADRRARDKSADEDDYEIKETARSKSRSRGSASGDGGAVDDVAAADAEQDDTSL